VMTWMLQHGVK